MVDRLRRLALVVAVLSVGAASAFADPDDESDWTPFVPPPASTPTVLTPTTSEGAFSDQERKSLLTSLHVSDQICRAANIHVDYNFGSGDFSGTGVGVSRYLRTLSDGKVALVDDEKLRVVYQHSLSDTLDGAGRLSGGFSFGAAIEGHSMIARRTGSKQSCDQVLRLLDLRDVKTILPIRAERIAKMALGEIWNVPMTLSYWQGVSLSEAFAPNASFSLSFGRNDTGAASMTLFRIADDKVRFRLRIDHVVAYSRSLGVTVSYPALVFAVNAKTLLMRFLEQQAAGQLAHYATAWLSLGHVDTNGDKIMIEFVVDPRDPAQAEALAKAMRGNFAALAWMSMKMSTLQTDSTMKDYDALEARNAAVVGPTAYKVTNRYKAKQESLSVNLPIFAAQDVSAVFGEDRIKVGGAQGEYFFFRAKESRNSRYFDLPFVGPQVKESSDEGFVAVSIPSKDGVAGPPVLVYGRNHAYYHAGSPSVRSALEAINRTMTLGGAQREANGRKLALPAGTFAPSTIKPIAKNGGILFTLVFNQRAGCDALAASSVQVLKAFGASLDAPEKPFMDWLVAHGKLGQNGALSFDWRAARLAFPDDPRAAPTALNGDGDAVLQDSQIKPRAESAIEVLERLSGRAAALLADLASARDAKSNEDRTRNLNRMIGGRGRSALSRGEALRILIQLVDPMDLTGDFVAGAHWALKRGRAEVEGLEEAGRVWNSSANPPQFPEGD